MNPLPACTAWACVRPVERLCPGRRAAPLCREGRWMRCVLAPSRLLTWGSLGTSCSEMAVPTPRPPEREPGPHPLDTPALFPLPWWELQSVINLGH